MKKRFTAGLLVTVLLVTSIDCHAFSMENPNNSLSAIQRNYVTVSDEYNIQSAPRSLEDLCNQNENNLKADEGLSFENTENNITSDDEIVIDVCKSVETEHALVYFPCGDGTHKVYCEDEGCGYKAVEECNFVHAENDDVNSCEKCGYITEEFLDDYIWFERNESASQSDGLKTVNYNMDLISQVGKQGSQMCMAYTLAYCRTILDGKVHKGSEYWKNGTGGMPSWANYCHSGANNKQDFLNMIVNQINAGRPVGMYVTKHYRSNQAWNASGDHWVAVIGYKSGANLSSLKTSDFYIIDPGSCSCDYLSDNADSFVYTTSNLLITNSGGTPIQTYHDPIGDLDGTWGGVGKVYVGGWAFDWDRPTESVAVDVYVGEPGVFCGRLTANQERPDIGEGFPGIGNYHGFSGWVKVDTSLSGEQTVQVYALNIGGGTNNPVIGYGKAVIEKDTIPPVISDIKAINKDSTGYTVTCTVEDDGGIENISYVAFPTWTIANGQDDLPEIWPVGIQNGNKFSFRVKDEDHNFERGLYITDIYAYDKYGNYSSGRIGVDVQNTSHPRNKLESENGNVYELYDDLLTWDDAKKFCEEKGGHLVTITSQQEEDVIESLIQKGASRESYFIGLDVINKKWVTDEALEYAKWDSGQPSNSFGNENVGEIVITSKGLFWNDVNDAEKGRGFILEYEASAQKELEKITLNKTFIILEAGKIVQLTAKGEPEDSSKNLTFTWTSDNLKVATVSPMGLVEAVSPGQAVVTVSCGKHSDKCVVKVVSGDTAGDENNDNTDGNANDPDSPDHDVMFICAIEDQYYTGSAIKPQAAVYHGNKKLVAGKDYTITYKNNINVSTAEKPAYAIIKGIGDYSETQNVEFKILPMDIGKALVEDVASPYNGKTKPLPKVSYNGKVLKKNVDYTIESAGTGFKEIGKYPVIYRGIKNFTGSVKGYVMIYSAEDKAKSIGTAVISLEKNKYEYTGYTIRPEVTSVTLNGINLTNNKDYQITYGVNKAVGKGTILIQGKGEYFGSKKVTFTIGKKAAKELTAEMVCITDSVTYEKGGCQPAPIVTDNGTVLTKGTDYTCTYKNNKKIGAGTITIKGKGIYKGTVSKDFSIEQKDISKATVRAADVIFNKKSAYKSAPVLTDSNGKVLVKGTDYKDVQYYYNGEVILKGSELPDDAEITITVNGKGNFTGTASTTYRYRIAESISKSKVSTLNKRYTGTAVKLDSSDISVVKDGVTLVYGTDYEIISSSYKNNVKKGTATVVIRGLGKYAGEKTVKFKIKARSILNL